jgi:hypothetical protein
MIMMIHVVPCMVDAAPLIARFATLAAAGSRTPLLHSMMGTLPARPSGSLRWSAPACQCSMTLELARYSRLRDGARSDNLSDVRFRDRRGA